MRTSWSLFTLLSLALAAGCDLVRSDALGTSDAGTTATLLELNGELTEPGATLTIAPNSVATSAKVLVRQDTAKPPNCYYGVFASDPRFLPSASGGGQPDNGLLLLFLADMNKINGDPSLGGPSRSSCPVPSLYAVGGALPDTVAPGDSLQISGQLTPYCATWDRKAQACATPVLSEFIVGSGSDLGTGTAPTPMVVQPVDLAQSGLSTSVNPYLAMLVEVDNVVTLNPTADVSGSIIVAAPSSGTSASTGLWISTFDGSVSLPQVKGQVFTKIVGELFYSGGHWRLQPRTQADVVPQ